MSNIQPGVVFRIHTLDGGTFDNMVQTRFTGYDTTLYFKNDRGDVVPAHAISHMKVVR